MLFYADPPRCIQQWVDAKTTVTLVSNMVAKCVRGSPERLRKLEAKAKAEAPHGGMVCTLVGASVHPLAHPSVCAGATPCPCVHSERREGQREDHLPLQYVQRGGVGLVTRHTKEMGDEAVILPCPVLTGFYQTFFRGVDRADAVGGRRPPFPSCAALSLVAVPWCVAQKRAHYTVHQPSHRTHLPLFFFALDVAMVSDALLNVKLPMTCKHFVMPPVVWVLLGVQVNAFILHETFYERLPLRDQLEFRLQLIDQVLQYAGVDVDTVLQKKRQRTAGAPRFNPASVAHLPRRLCDHVSSTTGATTESYKECVHCKATGRGRRETSLYCTGCNVALCVGVRDCFYEYHVAIEKE